MAGEEGVKVDIDNTSGDATAPSQEDAVKRYDQEQGVAAEENAEQSTETEDNSQKQSEDNSETESTTESESETEDNSESDSESEDNSESDSESEESPEENSSDFSEYFKEFNEKGELSEDSLKKLEEQGIPRDTVKDYIKSRTQLAEAISSSALEIAGGSEQYKAMSEWMRNNLDKSELQEYNKAVDSGDFKSTLDAVRNMKSRYDESVGSETSMVTDNTDSVGTAVAGYNSRAEMQKDMLDSRYDNDPAFREQVRKKLASAKF